MSPKPDTPAQARFDDLVEAARAATSSAYAPYSKYAVGAAILTASGEIVAGCNVENASYGLAICAERNAIFAARARGLVDPKTARLQAVAIHSTGVAMPWPCGACRQVLWEFAAADLSVLVDGRDRLIRSTLGELLPHGFRLEDA